MPPDDPENQPARPEPGLDLLLVDDESSFFHPKYLGKAPAPWEDNFLSRQLTNAMLWGLMTPKLAVPLLSAHAKAAGHSVETVYRPLLAWKLAKFRGLLGRGPRVVGISTVAVFDAAYLARIVGEVRRHSPASIVVLGGQGAADYPEVRALGDLYISGHGEQALADLVAALKGGADLDRLPVVSSGGFQGGAATIAPTAYSLAGPRRSSGPRTTWPPRCATYMKPAASGSSISWTPR